MPTCRTLGALLACLCLAGTLEAAPQAPAKPAAPAATNGEQQPLVVLRMKDNSLLMGRIVREDADTVVFDAGSLGQLTLKKTDIVATARPGDGGRRLPGAANAPPPSPAGLGGFASKGKVSGRRRPCSGGTFTSRRVQQGVIDPRIPPRPERR